jgi:hypothetical protein
VLGWGLPALGVACLITSQWMGISSDAAWSTAQAHVDAAARAFQTHPTDSNYAAYEAAHSAYLTGRAAYAAASLRSYLFVAAGWLAMLTVPGVLYARDPSLLGGPLGRLFRWLAFRGMRYQTRRRHPVTFYQGVGFLLLGIALAAYAVGVDIPKLFINVPIGSAASAAAVWLIAVPMIFSPAVFIVSIPLTFGAPLSFSRAQQEQA